MMMTNLLDNTPKEHYKSPIKAGIIAGFIVVFLFFFLKITRANYFLWQIIKDTNLPSDIPILMSIALPVGLVMIYIAIWGSEDYVFGNMLVSGFIAAEVGFWTFWLYGYSGAYDYSSTFTEILFDIVSGHLYLIGLIFYAFIVWLFIEPYQSYKAFKRDQRLRDFKNNPHG